MKQQENTRKISRGQIDNPNRVTSFSKREFTGKIKVLREDFKCPKCNHHKGIRNSRGKKCTRCTWRKY